MHVRDTYEHAIEELKERCEERKSLVDDERKKFMEFKKQVALNSVSNRSGKPIPPKVSFKLSIAFTQFFIWSH